MPSSSSTGSSTGKRAAEALIARLESLFAAIVTQVRQDPKFATRVEAALQAGGPREEPPRTAAPAPPRPPKHQPAVLDPFVVYEEGWEVMLQQRLERLDARQLRDVIHQFELDPHERVADEKSPERLREWIVKAVLTRAEKV